MGTLVCFHAHPDDEAISTGGSMARAAAEGHRVVLVVATDGRHGEVPDDLADGELLEHRRRRETDASAAALGISRVEFLPYHDSGMTGWDANDHDNSFLMAGLDEAAGLLAKILLEERADVLRHRQRVQPECWRPGFHRQRPGALPGGDAPIRQRRGGGPIA